MTILYQLEDNLDNTISQEDILLHQGWKQEDFLATIKKNG